MFMLYVLMKCVCEISRIIKFQFWNFDGILDQVKEKMWINESSPVLMHCRERQIN